MINDASVDRGYNATVASRNRKRLSRDALRNLTDRLSLDDVSIEISGISDNRRPLVHFPHPENRIAENICLNV